MQKIYCVKEIDVSNWTESTEIIGCFTSLSKANEAVKKRAYTICDKRKITEKKDGRLECILDQDTYIIIHIYESDVYLPDIKEESY